MCGAETAILLILEAVAAVVVSRCAVVVAAPSLIRPVSSTLADVPPPSDTCGLAAMRSFVSAVAKLCSSTWPSATFILLARPHLGSFGVSSSRWDSRVPYRSNRLRRPPPHSP
eukprot:3220077-Prymnesium_polylepis.1